MSAVATGGLSDLIVAESSSGALSSRLRRVRLKLRWVGLVAIVAALLGSGIGRRAVVNPGGWTLFARFWRAAASPTLSRDFLEQSGRALLTTVAYAVLGAGLSLVLGALGGVVLSQRALSRRIRTNELSGLTRVLRMMWAIPRGMHEAVWALLLLSILGRDPLVAILAIGLPYGAITAKVYADMLDESAARQHRTLRAAGAGRLQALVFGTIPSTAPELVSYAFYRFECAVRAAVVLGMVGAGGIGFQLSQSFQGLAYHEMWTSLYVLIGIGAVAEWWSSRVRRQSRSDRGVGRRSLASGAVLVAASWWYLRPGVSSLWSMRTAHRMGRFFQESFPPKLPRGGWNVLLHAALATLHVSFLAIVGATSLAIPLALLAARQRSRRPIHSATDTAAATDVRVAGTAGVGVGVADGTAARPRRRWRVGAGPLRWLAGFIALVCRSIPPTVWALLALFVLFPGVLPGAVALGIYTAGVLIRLFAESLENADHRPSALAAASGAGRAAALAYGTLPTVAPRWAAFALYRWEVAARDAAVVGVVGAGGLGRLLSEQTAGFAFPRMTTTILSLIAVTILVDAVSSLARSHLR